MAKKTRTSYTPRQVCYLEEKFTEDDFPSKSKRKDIASFLNLSEHHVQVIYMYVWHNNLYSYIYNGVYTCRSSELRMQSLVVTLSIIIIMKM